MTPTLQPGSDRENAGLAAHLAQVLGRVGRGLRYRTRAAREALDVTHSEGELLRLLHRRPGIRVQEAALELGVASNSVSTLVKQLGRVGLIQRTTDPADGRGACLHLTTQAEDYVTRVGNAREEVLERALASLDAAERAALEAAVPALCSLARAISRVDGANQ
jgi:DNA-binding MarR family transcriptional regulator